ncbi:MAG: hypothetical protein AB9891_13410 [Anaerolineaceae bacterium]
MGRKGVSKRKEKKTKPVISDAGSGSVSSIVHASENKPVKSFDTSKDSPSLLDNKRKSKKK